MTLRWEFGEPAVREAVERALAGERARVLHDNARRRILHVADPVAGELAVKHFRAAGGRHPRREAWKARLGRSPAGREARALRELHARGVPVPEPLGLAARDDGDRLLVLRFLPGVDLAGLARAPRRERLDAWRRVGEAVAALHAAGFVHGDLHAGNLRFTPGGPFLLDLQHARATTDPALRRADLGQLDYSLWERARSAERIGVRAAALGLTRPFGPEARSALRAVGEAARQRAREHGRSRTRRALRPGRRFVRVRADGGAGLQLRELPGSFLAEALGAHCDALAAATGAVLEDDGRTRISAVRAGGRPVIVKQVPRGPLQQLGDGVRGSPARRAWLGGHGLQARGVGAATPLAFVEWRRLGIPVRSAVVLEDLRPAPDVLTAAAARPGPVLAGVARLLVALHRREAVHLDLKATNLLWVESPDGAAARLIDLEDVRFPGGLDDAQRLEALAQLNASLPDTVPADARRAAFDRYCAALPFAGGSRAALRRVVARSLERAHRWTGCG